MEEMATYSERLVYWCEKTIEMLGWDFEQEEKDWQEKGSRRILPSEDLKRKVQKAVAEADLNYGRGITTLYDRIPVGRGGYMGFAEYFGYSNTKDFNKGNIEDQYKFALHLLDLIDLYNDWNDNEFKHVIANIAGQNKFDDPEFTLPPSILEDVNKLVNGGTFKIYTYRDGGHKMRSTDNFHISTLVGISEDLTMWLDHVERQQEFLSRQDESEIFVTMFGKIDPVHPIYSSWLLTMHKGDTIWLVSDTIDFDNPAQKHRRLGRKSVWESTQDKYDLCDLPYNLFHDLDELRKSATGLVKNINRHEVKFKDISHRSFDTGYKGKLMGAFEAKLSELGVQYDVAYSDNTGSYSFPKYDTAFAYKAGRLVARWEREQDVVFVFDRPEVLFHDFRKLGDGQKAFTMLLVNEVIQWATSVNLDMPKVMLSSQFIDMKLLEGAKFDPVKEETRMRYWKEKQQMVFYEILDTIKDIEGEENVTALALQSYDMVLKSKHYDNSWLATPEKLEGLAEWMVLDNERKLLEPALRKLAAMKKEGELWLYDTLNANYDLVLSKVTLAKEIRFFSEFIPTFGGYGGDKDRSRAGHINMVDLSKKSVYDQRGQGIGKDRHRKDGWYPQDCIICEQYSSKKVARIEFRYYKQIMWLLDIERKDIHPYFRNYRAHDLVPYTGNSLLDQTHPYLEVQDPASRANANGLSVELFMCGNCWKKHKPTKEELEVVL